MKPLPSALLLAGLLSAGCSGDDGPDQPGPEAFAAGTCRQLADPVLALGRDLRKLGDSKAPPMDVRNRIRDEQKKVRDVLPSAPADLMPVVQDLVTAVGVVRLSSDTNSYEPSLSTKALAAYDALVARCTTTASPTPAP